MTLYQTINPYTQAIEASFDTHTPTELQQILEQAQARFHTWKRVPMRERGAVLHEVARQLLVQKQSLAELITREMGKPLTQSIAEVEKSAWVCTYFADHADTMLRREDIVTENERSYVIYQPLGVLLQIMPWNFPFWQVFRFAAPALMAGNVVLLKHAPNVPQCAQRIQTLITDACTQVLATRTALVWNVRADNDSVAKLLANPIVQGVTLTGSNRAGAAVASIAGAHIKKSVLELGGSDACIVCADADVERAVKLAMWSRMQNTGQTCIASKRFIVHRSIVDTFIDHSRTFIQSLIMDNPLLPTTQLGTMARPDLVELLENQVAQTIHVGAKVALQGGRVADTNFFKPMMLLDVAPQSRAYQEELFGCVATVYTYDHEDEAIQLANSTIYGLGATIWTQDTERAEALALDLEVGAVAINQLLKSDPRIPFGGVKQSGYGRELGKHGIREFTNIKSIVV